MSQSSSNVVKCGVWLVAVVLGVSLEHCGLAEEADCPITLYPLTDADLTVTQDLYYRQVGSADLFYLPGDCFGQGAEFHWDYSGEAIYEDLTYAANSFEVLTSGTMCGYMRSGNGKTERLCKDVNVYRNHIWGVTATDFPGGESKQTVTMTLNGDVYSGFGMYNNWFKFDTITYRWVEKSAIPNLLDFNAFAGFAIDGIGYIVGNNSVLYAYDPNTDTWASKGSLPDLVSTVLNLNAFGVRSAYAHSVLGLAEGGKGYFGIGVMDRLYMYEPATNSWSRLADRPERGAIGDHQFAYNGKIYSGKYEYDIATDTWKVGQKSFTIASGYSPGFVPFKGVMYGGLSGKTVFFDGDRLSPIDLEGATQFVSPARNLYGGGAATGNLIIYPRLLNASAVVQLNNYFYLDK